MPKLDALFDALLPSWYFGMPVVGYRGKFDAEKAYYLLEKYKVTSTFLFPTALKLMMKAVPEPRKKFKLALRSLMSAGESVGTTVLEWAKEGLGVTINEMFGQTEINYVVGNCHVAWPVKPGSIEHCSVGTSRMLAIASKATIPRPTLERCRCHQAAA